MNLIIWMITGHNLNNDVYRSIQLFVNYIFSLFVVFPLLGKLLHIPLLSLWNGAKVDIKNMEFYIPAAYTFSLVGVYFLAKPISFLLHQGNVQSTVSVSWLSDYSRSPVLIILNITISVFIGPLVEEFFSRGLLLPALAPYGKGFAIIITAIDFGLGYGNFMQLFGAFLSGLVFGYVTLKTGTTKNSFILHAINNGVAVLLGIIYIYSPSVGNILPIAVYAVLGGIGI